MLKKSLRSNIAVYAPIPLLDEEFVCDDFHPAIFELAALTKSAYRE